MDFGLSLHLQALAFLYDNTDHFPAWVRRLTPGQISELATLITRWETSNMPRYEVLPLDIVERREVARALAKFQGDVCAAAKALGIGKTTLYRKLKAWGFSHDTWVRISQAAALAQKPRAVVESRAPHKPSRATQTFSALDKPHPESDPVQARER
jgi:hypothetical protein